MYGSQSRAKDTLLEATFLSSFTIYDDDIELLHPEVD